MKGKLKTYEKEILMEYDNGVSGSILAKKYNVSESSIYRLINRLGGNVRSMSDAKKKYTLNENYFENIDSEDKAYFLGLLYADGYNNINKSHVYITLHQQDIEILELFNKQINSNKPLRKDRGYIRLAIENKNVSNQLNKLGCVPNKHNTISLPNFLDKELMRHFIRGFFDGDGLICESKTSKQMNITSNKNFISELQQYLIDILGLNKTKIFKRYDKEDSAYTMFYGGRMQLKKIYKYFYNESSFYLKRKKKKFEIIIKEGD
jgi:hypothetical protein